MREMKNSGIEWIGEIPKDWNTVKLKYIITFIYGYAFDSSAMQQEGVYPVIRIGDIKDGSIDYSNCLYIENNDGLETYRILKDDILVAMSGATVGKIGYSYDNTDSYINQRVGIIRSDMPRFLFYVLSTQSFINHILLESLGSAQPNVSNTNIGIFCIPFPSIPEQLKIAYFLDNRCAEIDALTSDIESQIDMLEQYKRSVITEAVTKGLNPDVEMKDSGIEWVGEIPTSWTMQKGKYIFQQKNLRGNGISLQLLSPTQKFGVIPQSMYEELTGMSPVKLNDNTDLSMMKTIHKGDFCISLRSFQGGFEYSEYEGVVSPAYQVFYPVIDIADGYYKYLFKETGFIQKMNSYTMTLRDGKNIAFSDFGNTYIPYPPVSEQKEIADYLDNKCSDIDAIIADKQAQLDTLAEYKKSLIYEYVTGKKGTSIG